MIYCFDIDGTICTQEIDYSDAKPYPERILRIKMNCMMMDIKLFF